MIYGIAWFAPAIGLSYYDGEAAMAARTGAIAGTSSPPLFPAVLWLFALVSQQAQWLKLLPLLCTLLWLVLTRRLLMRMGATPDCATCLVLLTAASPTVMYLATGLFPEPLFAVLLTASLLALLDERALAAGVLAGLATLTLTKAAPLIVTGIVILTVTRRLRSAAHFALGAMLFAAPWLGWKLVHSAGPAVAKLHANELAVLLGHNVMYLAAAPFTLLTGYANLYPGLLTAIALLIVLIRRRQFIPDLFVGLYCIVLLFRTQPPLHAFAAVLPLFLWMLWRVARTGRFAIVTKVAAALMLAPSLWFSAARVMPVVTLGAVASETAPPNDWHEMQKLFAFIRANTPPDAVLLADLDPMFRLYTSRPAVRGFTPDSYKRYYAPPGSLVTPDQLLASLRRDQVTHVALTPDADLPESASFHKAVAAMERAGILEPVAVPGLSRDYRLLRVIH